MPEKSTKELEEEYKKLLIRQQSIDSAFDYNAPDINQVKAELDRRRKKKSTRPNYDVDEIMNSFQSHSAELLEEQRRKEAAEAERRRLQQEEARKRAEELERRRREAEERKRRELERSRELARREAKKKQLENGLKKANESFRILDADYQAGTAKLSEMTEAADAIYQKALHAKQLKSQAEQDFYDAKDLLQRAREAMKDAQERYSSSKTELDELHGQYSTMQGALREQKKQVKNISSLRNDAKEKCEKLQAELEAIEN